MHRGEIKKCFADTRLIHQEVWKLLPRNKEAIDNVIRNSIKNSYGTAKYSSFHESMIRVIYEAIEYFSSIIAPQTLQDIVNHMKLGKEIPSKAFCRCFKKCISILTYLFGEETKCAFIDRYVTFHGYLDDILTEGEKEQYSYGLVNISSDQLEIILTNIESIQFSGPSKDKKRLQKSLLEIISNSEASITTITALIDIIRELTNSTNNGLIFLKINIFS